VGCSVAASWLLALATRSSGARLSVCRAILAKFPQSIPNKGRGRVLARTDYRAVSSAAGRFDDFAHGDFCMIGPNIICSQVRCGIGLSRWDGLQPCLAPQVLDRALTLGAWSPRCRQLMMVSVRLPWLSRSITHRCTHRSRVRAPTKAR